MSTFAKYLPVHVSVDWKQFDEFLNRIDCPFLDRPEYCERCDGYFPVCPRPDMRPLKNQPMAPSSAPRPKQNSV